MLRRRRLASLWLQRLRLGKRAGGRSKGGLASRRRSAGSRTLPLPTTRRERGCLCRCVPMGGSQKAPSPQVPPLRKITASTLPPFGKRDVTQGGGGDEQLHGHVATVHAGGVEIFDLAGTNASRSACMKLCAWGVEAALHTPPPPPCNAIKKVVCILQCGWCCGTCNTPQWSGGTPPPQQICHAREGV